MEKAVVVNELPDLEEEASILIGEWLNLVDDGHYQSAALLCSSFIDTHALAFKKYISIQDEHIYNFSLIILVFIKGLQDFSQISQLISNEDWYRCEESVEKIWTKLWDCDERIKFISQFCSSEAIDRVTQNLSRLSKFFKSTFGDGIYVSPAILADQYLCSICHNDARACFHISGRIYGGKICSYQPVNPNLNHIAIVQTPKDPRCRVWQWNLQDNDEGKGLEGQVCILTTFRLDGFLYED